MTPIWLSLALGCVAFGALFLLFWLPRRGDSYDMDPMEKWGAFEPHLKRYQELARLVLTLASASIAFLVNLLVGINPSVATRSVYSIRLEYAWPWAVGAQCVTVICVIAFMLLLSYFYEEYMHHAYYPDAPEYKTIRSHGVYYSWKSSIIWALAWCGLLSFFASYLVLAAKLFR